MNRLEAPPGDHDEFVQRIRDLMYHSARRGALGAAARRYVLLHHAPDAVARSFEDSLGLAGGLRDANPAHRAA